MVLTDQNGRVLFRSPTAPGGCPDIVHARRSGPVGLLADAPSSRSSPMPAARVSAPRAADAW